MKKKYKYFYGFNTIKNLIKFKSNYIKKIFLIKKNSQRFLEIKKLVILNNISYKVVYNFSFKNINYVKHQGFIAFIKKKMFFNSMENFIDLIHKKKKHFFLILDSIDNPNNLGSCIRTAVAANIDAIILSKHNSVSIENNIVHKVSTGSIYKIFIIIVNNIANIINLLNKYNFFIFGTDINSKTSIYKINFNKYNSIAIILGSEKSGIRKKIKEKCNFLFKIPTKNVNSLNVSVSSGIIIFEIIRQKNL